MHENYTMENCTLQIEDIDSQAAKGLAVDPGMGRSRLYQWFWA